MRSVGLILLAGLLVFVPAVQAQSCFCASVAATDHGAATENEPASCCCSDSASCACAGCSGHDGATGREQRDSLSGCICTRTQPQISPAQIDAVDLPDTRHHEALPIADAPRAAIESVATVEGSFRPPSSLPLLL